MPLAGRKARAMTQSSQKFLARNRPPRVHIEYEVETYGSQASVQLPFVMAVLADLSGQAGRAAASVQAGAGADDLGQRRFVDIDADTFDQRMRALSPRVAFSVPDTLGGSGQMSVDLCFHSIEDFSPAAVASKVGALRALLHARTQLANLQTYIDGKTGAEELVCRLLRDPQWLRALAQRGPPAPAAAPAAVPAAPPLPAPPSAPAGAQPSG